MKYNGYKLNYYVNWALKNIIVHNKQLLGKLKLVL